MDFCCVSVNYRRMIYGDTSSAPGCDAEVTTRKESLTRRSRVVLRLRVLAEKFGIYCNTNNNFMLKHRLSLSQIENSKNPTWKWNTAF